MEWQRLGRGELQNRFTNIIFYFFSDTLPDYPWITEFPVQNIENIPEHNGVTAQEVLEETILSPAENLLGKMEELDHFFPEEFINLAAMESNMNSFNTDPLTGLLATDVIMPNGFGNFLVDAKEGVACEDACQIQNGILDVLKSKPENPGNNILPEPITDFDTTAVVPNVVPASPLSVPDSPVDTTDSGVFANNFSLDIDQFNPEIIALLENLETSVESNVEPNGRKRILAVEEESNVPIEAPAIKKKKQQSCSSTDEETITDKVVERRIKNNAASRVCRASRKARHQELFQCEKELSEENKVLAKQVKDLSATVEYLRNYLVNRLSGQ